MQLVTKESSRTIFHMFLLGVCFMERHGLIIPHRAQSNKCVQHFKAICIDRGSDNVNFHEDTPQAKGRDLDISGSGNHMGSFARRHFQKIVYYGTALLVNYAAAIFSIETHQGRSAMSRCQVEAVQ
eukprot:6182384-Pleurochrysis_carterae.AAC.1